MAYPKLITALENRAADLLTSGKLDTARNYCAEAARIRDDLLTDAERDAKRAARTLETVL